MNNCCHESVKLEIMKLELVELRKIRLALEALNKKLAIPVLTRLGVTFMPKSLEVGQSTVATVSGLDQFGQPFPLDFGSTPPSWSLGDASLATGVQNPDGSFSIATAAAGSETVTVALGGLSQSDTLTIALPAAKLSGLLIAFS